MSAPFVHLHLHSEFSLADSTIRIGELVSRCVALGQPAVAITDLNNLFATVKFYRKAEAAGIKPVIGADIGLADGNETPTRLTLLCRDRDGYLTLSRLLSRMWMEGHRTDGVAMRPEWLREDNAGLFALAGLHSQAGQLAKTGRTELAEASLADWQGVFGERLHLELTRTGRDGEGAFNAFALHAAGKRGVPVVASNDARFLDADGFDAHEARVCIASGRVLDDPRRPKNYTPEQYLKSSAQMAELFDDAPDAIDNALALATRCNVEMKLGEYALPAFPVPSDHTIESWLRSQSREGLDKRLEKAPLAEGRLQNGMSRADYDQRLETELEVIIKMGFPGYFLIVADFINWGKQQGIPVGPGRGSGAGSLVAWALGITDLDPLPYDLLFERFLNPERVSMPDFDIDFCMDRRDEVIDYVARTYGRDRVSQIITYGTMAAKAVVRDSGRVLGHPYGFVDGIAKLIPNTLGISLDDAMGESEKARATPDLASSDLIARYRSEDEVRDLIDLARSLEDLTRNAGKHAGGVVIAPSPLSDFCPLFAEHDGEGRGKSPVTQFDKDDVEAVGLVKFDFLGLRTLTIIDWAVKAINKRLSLLPPAGEGARRADEGARSATDSDAPPSLDITALPLDDQPTYDLFARGDTVAVFQFESRGMRELLKRAQPDTFEDIIALAALFRPGPLGSGMDKDWVDRKHGRADVTFPHESLEPVLAPTYGVIVYQEQVMQIAQVMAGYSLGGADLLRRAMGKKKAEEMAKERAKFEAGCDANGIPAKVASPIFDLMEKFAEYGFNKSHSAAYALVAYQTAWLKVHYPAEFMAAVLSSDMDNTDKVTGFLDECRAMGLTVLPPDVDSAAYMFEAVYPSSSTSPSSSSPASSTTPPSPPNPPSSSNSPSFPRRRESMDVDPDGPDGPDAATTGTIQYGLGAVKGVGRGACEAIIEARRAGPFADLLDFCKRVEPGKLNRRALEALAMAGALDKLGKNRASLMLQLPEVLRATEQLAREREAGQVSLFGGGGGDGTDDSGAAPALHIELRETDEYPLGQLLAGERETLGHYLSGHPFDPYRSDLRDLIGHDLGDLESIWESRPESARSGWRPEIETVIAGQVVGLRKKGDSQTFVQIEDGRGRLEVAFFSETATEYAHLLTRDRILVIQGGLREDAFSGGFALKAARCWDYNHICAQHAKRLSLRLDLRVPGIWNRIDELLAQHRPGSTPIRVDLIRPGAAGMLDLNGSHSVRVDAELAGTLRAVPGVKAVKVSLGRPWGG